MKVKYEVIRVKEYVECTPIYERVSSFRGEREAKEFTRDFDNIRKYGDMHLEKRDSDGMRYVWVEDTDEWMYISKPHG